MRGGAFRGGGSLREQWRNNVQIAVSDAPSATQVSNFGVWTLRFRYRFRNVTPNLFIQFLLCGNWNSVLNFVYRLLFKSCSDKKIIIYKPIVCVNIYCS